MSGPEMRKIMESISKATMLREDYESRVDTMVDAIQKEYPNGITRKQFQSEIDQINQKYDLKIPELRSSQPGLRQKTGDSRKEFVQDVAKKIDFKKDTSKQDAKRERVKKALDDLYWIAQDAIGNSFPDGDPIDQIIPKARRLGIPMDSVSEWLDRAFKKHEGIGYNEHLARLWDDQYNDAKSDMGHVKPEDDYYTSTKSRYDRLGGRAGRNPWR